jgi:hypothetical protein
MFESNWAYVTTKGQLHANKNYKCFYHNGHAEWDISRHLVNFVATTIKLFWLWPKGGHINRRHKWS